MSTTYSHDRSLQKDAKTFPASFYQQRLCFFQPWNPQQSHDTPTLLRIHQGLLNEVSIRSCDLMDGLCSLEEADECSQSAESDLPRQSQIERLSFRQIIC